MKKMKRKSGAIYEKTDISELYRWLDNLSVKQSKSSENVDSSVDAFLSRRQRISVVKKRCSANSWLKHARSYVSFDFVRRVPVRKIAAVLMSLIILFVMIPSLLPFLYGGFDSDVSILFEPDGVYPGDTMNISVYIPFSYNITNVSVDMSGFDTVFLSIVNKTWMSNIWQSSWLIPNVPAGSYVAWINAFDVNGTPYSAGKQWRVLSSMVNQTNVSDTDVTEPVIDTGDEVSNETVPVGVLNVSIGVDKEYYRVNDTVFVSGFVTFNDSLVNASVDLLVVGPDVNESISLNATMDGFSYDFVPIRVGSYKVQFVVFYENMSVAEDLVVYVQGLPPQNVTDVNVTDLVVWDDTDYLDLYVGDNVTFYANCYRGGVAVENATCLISFLVNSNWTKLVIMNYSHGAYVYTRSFNMSGSYDFNVSCFVPGYGNLSVVNDFVILKPELGVFEPVSQVEVGKPVLWSQSFYVEDDLMLNISGFAYNISVAGVHSEDDVFVVDENVSKSLIDYNTDKRKEVLAESISGLLTMVESDPDDVQSQQEIHQLYSMLNDNVSSEESLNESYSVIEEYVSDFVVDGSDVQLFIMNVSDVVEVSYLTSGPEIIEEPVSDGKRVVVSSDVHYEDVFTYISIVESLREHVRLYWLVDDSYELVRDVTCVDTNGNGLIDRLEWITPSLSNQTYMIVITKAEHLDEDRSFVSDIYDEVYRKDGVWSEPIYHDEYVRVTFIENLTRKNDITFYARNSQGLNTRVEVYYYDSDEKIAEFPVIKEERYYKVYLIGLVGSQRVFDLRVKNLDGLGSAFLEFDYIVDPEEKNPVDSNNSDNDSSSDVGTESNFPNCQDTSPDYNNMTITEVDNGTAEVNEYKYVSTFDSTINEWDQCSANPPWISADDSEYISEHSTNGENIGWFSFDDTSETGSGFTVQFDFLCYGDDGDDGFDLYYDIGGGSTLLGNFIITQTGGYAWLSEDTTLTDLTAEQINAMKVYFTTDMNSGGDDIYVDACRMHITRAAAPDYEIDFEYNWTTANYSSDNEYVCIYVNDTTGGETLNVNYWNIGTSEWGSLGDITSVEIGWNNFTAAGLTDNCYTIQLVGATESGDSTQDSWDIDVILLHTWPNSYGTLNITWSTGSDIDCDCTSGSPCVLTQNETFWMNVTIKADGLPGDIYGVVSVGARDNRTGSMSYINTTAGGTPFYVNGSSGSAEGILNGTWYYRSPTAIGGIFDERERHAMAHYASVNRTILFSGKRKPGVPEINDTWAYNYSTNIWYNMTPGFVNGSLSAREDFSLVYDSTAERIILFGGSKSSVYYNDTWVYNYTDNKWYNKTPTISYENGTLKGGNQYSMAYDSHADRTILLGGYNGAVWTNETWEYNYNTNTWNNLTPTMTTSDPFIALLKGQLVYDSQADRCILFGGQNINGRLNETWEYNYNTNTWTNLTPTMTTVSGWLEPRSWHRMVYDSHADRIIMFSGNRGTNDHINDTWTYNYTTNTWCNVSYTTNGSGTLWPREASGMAYDSTNKRTILMGGFCFPYPVNDMLDDTWIYNYTGTNSSGGGTNPEELGTLSYGNIKYVNFSINATGTGNWMLDVNVTSDNDNVADNETCTSYVVIGQAPPTQSNQKIWNSTTSTEWDLSESPTSVNLTPTSLNVTINDPNAGDTMDITLRTNESGSWTTVNESTGLSSGTYNFTNTSWIDSYSTKYWISFNLTDGTDWSNETFSFTTTAAVGNNPPQQSSQKIWNNSTSEEWTLSESPTDVSRTPTSFNVTISDPDGNKMNITILENNTGTWKTVNQTSGTGLSDGTYNFTNTSWIISFDTKYWIFFNVTDGIDWTNQTFNFTTESENTTIEVSPATWSQGDVDIGSSNETTGNYFTITNNGNVDVVITINATNATNATGVVKWYLAETASYDHFVLQYKKNGEESWTNINYSFNTFIANLPWTGEDYKTFDLKIIMATTSSTTQPLNVTVTFKSVKA